MEQENENENAGLFSERQLSNLQIVNYKYLSIVYFRSVS